MRGYVQNEGRDAFFILQRRIPPGGKVRIEDAYRSVGKKSGLEEGPEFVKWLLSDVLTRGSWGVYEEEGKPLFPEETENKEEEAEVPPKSQVSSKTSSDRSKDAPGAGRALRRESSEERGVEITPGSIIEAPYDQARTLIEKTRDRGVLKKALALTQHFSGKEQHMRHLMKRLEQVY
jgi:hypothetical protein